MMGFEWQQGSGVSCTAGEIGFKLAYLSPRVMKRRERCMIIQASSQYLLPVDLPLSSLRDFSAGKSLGHLFLLLLSWHSSVSSWHEGARGWSRRCGESEKNGCCLHPLLLGIFFAAQLMTFLNNQEQRLLDNPRLVCNRSHYTCSTSEHLCLRTGRGCPAGCYLMERCLAWQSIYWCREERTLRSTCFSISQTHACTGTFWTKSRKCAGWCRRCGCRSVLDGCWCEGTICYLTA